MGKRNVFDEIMQGFDELKQEREGKLTLRTTEVELLPPVEITAAEIIAIRENLNMSRALFAAKLRLEVRTLERWEQGRSRVGNAPATLIKLAAKYPDTFEKVAGL